MSLAERSISSVAWNVGANVAKIAVLLARSILLARLLPVETFGVYALATSIVSFSGILPMFGMGSAFLHRAPETDDEEQAASIHFTLRLLLTALWAAALLAGSFMFTVGPLRLALVVLTLSFAGLYLTDTPKIILARRVQHRRLAMLDLLTAVFSSLIAVVLARLGFGLTALLATDVMTLTLAILVLYAWQPVWRPRLSWARETVRYYLRFGSRTMAGGVLSEAIDNVDDIWVGAALGSQALGLYSRAYTFATYPRRILAFPVNMVAGGTYAELKTDRRKLSQAFFRTNALLIRSGFLMGGLLIIVAPEFVRLALGEKWLPMVPAFRLMAVFTLLDPIRVTVSQVFVAVGQPERIIRVRLVQLVAMVVNVVLLIGLIPLLHAAREHVDYSARRLFFAPTLAVVSGVTLAIGATETLCRMIHCGDWMTGMIKGSTFTLTFAGILLLLERQQIVEMSVRVRDIYRGREQRPSSQVTEE
jgi:O-antigen/teichoic acid export membrane protein